MATRLERQAQACSAMGSRFTAQLLEAAASDYRAGREVRGLLDSHPEFTRPGLHLAGALHYLALTGETALARHYPSVGGDGDARAAWIAARAILAHDPSSIEELFARLPQTNEAARSMPLLAAFAALAARCGLPLRIAEIGASAGLNLRFDRFRYAGAGWQWGDANSQLTLRNRVARGQPAHLGARIEVAQRSGCDLFPLDVSRESDRLRLESFVWPDQAERFERLRRAIAVARELPVRIDAESYETWLPREARCRPGVVTAIVHTIFLEHFTAVEREKLDGAIATLAGQASDDAPLARIWMELENGAYPTKFATWPGPAQPTLICTSDGHAQDIVWA